MKIIRTKYLGQTTTLPARIRASDEDGHSVSISHYISEKLYACPDEAAIALCKKMRWTEHGLVRGNTRDGCVYVFDVPEAKVRVS